jgi:hypothetical protein
MKHASVMLLAIVAGELAGCGTPTVLSLAESRPVTTTPTEAVPLEVVTRGTAVRDPLPVSGGHTVVSGLEEALGHAVSTAAVPWAIRQPHRSEGWQLTVELTRADARYSRERLAVSLNVRATLRTRIGRIYLAQTQAHCRQAALVPAADGAPIFYACLTQVSRDLVDWLGGVQ